MKKYLIINTVVFVVLMLVSCGSKKSTVYPKEWAKYDNEYHYFDIKSGTNNQHIEQSQFEKMLLDWALEGLKKQVQTKAGNVEIEKNLIKTETHTDKAKQKTYVIAYINKREACQYYEKELQRIQNKVEKAFQIANDDEQQGFKPKAITMLKQALADLDLSEEIFFWFNVYEMPTTQVQQHRNNVQQAEHNLKTKIAELEQSTFYCVLCTADFFGKPYSKLETDIKNELSTWGCRFTDNAVAADYVIDIKASVREQQKAEVEGKDFYTSYVDVELTIDNNVVNQRIYNDEISIKGIHTVNYEDAARDGYKKTANELYKILKNEIF